MDENFNESSKSTNLLPFFLMLGLTVLPGFLVSVLIYLIPFRKYKQKPRVICAGLGVYSFFIYLWHLIFKPLTNISFTNGNSFIHAYIFICAIASVLITLIGLYLLSRELRLRPELKLQQGWAYELEYAKSPYEKWLRKKMIKELRDGEDYGSEASPLGVLDDKVFLDVSESGDREYFNKEQIVYSYYTEREGHTIATGQTGAGKTYTMLQLMKNDVMNGFPVVTVDFKKGTEYPYYLAKWAKDAGREFYHFTSGKPGTYKNPFATNQASYDPLANGTSTSKADMMLNLRTWDGASEVYKKRTKDILESIFFLLDNVNKEKTAKYIDWDEGGLSQFVAALKLENLFALMTQFDLDLKEKEQNGETISSGDRRRLSALKGLHAELSSPSGKGLKEQIDGLVSNCRTLIMSSYGDWLAKGETPNHIDLFKIGTEMNSPVVLFSFNPQEESDFAKYMGSIIMSDLSRTSANKFAMANKVRFGAYIDEFQILDPSTVADLLEKARSSKVFITLSLQSLEQIVKASSSNGIAVRDSIVDTIQNFIIHKGSGQNTADELAKIIGQARLKKYQISGNRSSGLFQLNLLNSRKNRVGYETVDDWIISPSNFQSLSAPTKGNDWKSTAYYITKACAEPAFSKVNRAVARKVHIIVDNEILEPIPEDFITHFNNSFDRDKNEKEYDQLLINKGLELPEKEYEFEEIKEDYFNLSDDEDFTPVNTEEFNEDFELSNLPPLGHNSNKNKIDSVQKKSYKPKNTIDLSEEEEFDNLDIFSNKSSLSSNIEDLEKQSNMTQKEIVKKFGKTKIGEKGKKKSDKKVSFEDFL